MLQIDEAITFAEVNPAHVDPVEEISGIIGKVPQYLGQMGIGVEGVGDVENDPFAALLCCGARAPSSLGRHGGHPCLVLGPPNPWRLHPLSHKGIPGSTTWAFWIINL
jgi:hypothetical protein